MDVLVAIFVGLLIAVTLFGSMVLAWAGPVVFALGTTIGLAVSGAATIGAFLKARTVVGRVVTIIAVAIPTLGLGWLWVQFVWAILSS